MAAVAEKTQPQEVPQDALKPTKGQLEANIRMSKRWREAIGRGTYSGQDVGAVAELLGFLEHQHDLALAQYEAEFSAHPEWGRPNDIPAAAKA